MRSIKLTLEYDGTNYCGWQIQAHKNTTRGRRGKKRFHKHKKSIQEIIEGLLQRILCEKIRLIVSGRTDAGAHALGQVANFKTNSRIALKKLHWALNGLSPPVWVLKLKE